MNLPYRCKLIANLLKKDLKINAIEVAERLNVTTETVRKDLILLEQEGIAERIRGGAVLKGADLLSEDQGVTAASDGTMAQGIAGMAEIGASLIKSGMTVMIDASEAAEEILSKVSKRTRISVITNSPALIARYANRSNISFVCTGGTYDSGTGSLTGSEALSVIQRFNADLAFISCAGAAMDTGYTDEGMEESEIRRAMADQSSRAVMLLPHSVLGNTAPVNSLHFDEIATAITDKAPEEDWQIFIEERQLEVLYPVVEEAQEQAETSES